MSEWEKHELRMAIAQLVTMFDQLFAELGIPMPGL